MRILVAACLVMLTTCAGAFAQTNDVDIPYQKMVLDNGLTLIVHEDHKAPIVAINTWYHVGVEEREAGEDRVRALVRALDVWRERPRQGQLHRGLWSALALRI